MHVYEDIRLLLRLNMRVRCGRKKSVDGQVGVRVSALHFWEQQGLLHPLREQYSRYRLYDEQQMRRLRVVARLRDAGYPFNVIQSVLDELAAGQPEKAIVTVEKRREELTRISWSCIEALSSFQHYVSDFGPHHSCASI
jgi:DNA-binding transcriptional MerR regulator